MIKILIALFLVIMSTSCTKKNEINQENKYDIEAKYIRSDDKNSLPLNETAESPKGTYKVKVSSTSKKIKDSDQDWWYAKLTILDKTGNIIFEDHEEYALWFPFHIRWIDDTSLEVYSGDVGTRILRF